MNKSHCIKLCNDRVGDLPIIVLWLERVVFNMIKLMNEPSSSKISKNNGRSIKEGLDSSSYEDLKYEVYRAAERAFNSFVTNNETNVSDDEITSIMREVTAQLLDSVVEI